MMIMSCVCVCFSIVFIIRPFHNFQCVSNDFYNHEYDEGEAKHR